MSVNVADATDLARGGGRPAAPYNAVYRAPAGL